MIWEDSFKTWGKAPGETESAETAIRKAVKANAQLSTMDISIIPKGSYKSRTNVRQDSDVDVCICLNSTFYPRYPTGKTREDYGNSEGSISFSAYKNLLQIALDDYFGSQNIERGNKAFDIKSNTYRVNADAVPAMAYRYYYGENYNDYITPLGTAFTTDEGKLIINWPHQVYSNGVEKQKNTGERYKKMVRIVKKLRNKMQEKHIPEALNISSFMLECLVWNVPDKGFGAATYTEDVRFVLATCFLETKLDGSWPEMKEVNDIKLLFGEDQPWTREEAHNFFKEAWNFLGF